MHNNPDIISKLRARGERITPIRTALIEILSVSLKPCTPQELLFALAQKGFSADKSTVYRQLETLKEFSIVEEVNFTDRIKRYELMDENGHHHHLVCLQCQRIEDVSFPTDLEQQEKMILKEHKFKVLQHSLEFFGICRKCQKNGAKSL